MREMFSRKMRLEEKENKEYFDKDNQFGQAPWHSLQPGTSFSTSLSLSCLICKTMIIMEPTIYTVVGDK